MKKTIYCFITVIVSICSSIGMTSCSVVMAAQGGGVDISTLSQCRTRSCLISKGAEPVSKKTDDQGALISEEYKAYSPTGSAARAAMHGALDVATFGLWEAAGTPIEAVKDKKNYYMINVTYKQDGETIKSVQLLQ